MAAGQDQRGPVEDFSRIAPQGPGDPATLGTKEKSAPSGAVVSGDRALVNLTHAR